MNLARLLPALLGACLFLGHNAQAADPAPAQVNSAA
jgi:hypothetical protein